MAKRPAASTVSPAAKASGKTYRILALDGGGIRGVISAIWLRELQSLMGKPLNQCFDLVAGTSTGSILACAVALGRDPDEILKLYETRGESIFPSDAGWSWSGTKRFFTQGPSRPKYDGVGLDQELEGAFGKTTFQELKLHTMVVAYDTENRETRVFKSWKNPKDDGAYVKCPVWQLVRSSCSAPTFFPAFALDIAGVEHSMIDGGVSANNPAACAIAEGVRLASEGPKHGVPLDRFVVCSLGTGALTRRISLRSAQEWGALEWAVPIIDVLFDGNADATDYIARQIIEKDNYFRLQTALDDAYDDMDNASKSNLNALKSVAMAYLDKEGRDLLKQLAKKL